MRLVVDTNVIVAGLLTRRGKPGQIVDRILDGRICVVYSAEILHEYRAVLARTKFAFDPQEVTDFLDALENSGEPIIASAPRMPSLHFPDPSDSVFFLVAHAAQCPLVTGNLKHFPKNSGVVVFSPSDLVGRVASSR